MNGEGDRRLVAPGTSLFRYVLLAVVVCAMGIGAVLVLAVTQPERDHTQTFSAIGAITAPLVSALIGAGLYGIGKSLDGRMTQLLQTTAAKAHNEGVIDGLVANPNVAITKDDVTSLKGRSE